MMASRNATCRFAYSALLVCALLAHDALGAPAGEVTHVSGALIVRKADGTSKILAPQSKIESGDYLATAAETYARVRFSDGGEVTMRPNSQLHIEAFMFEQANPTRDSAVFRLLKGGLRAVTGAIGKRKADTYQMKTTVATIGIRGTNFGVLLCQNDCQNLRTNDGQAPSDGLHVDVSQGLISVKNSGGEKLLPAGQFGFVRTSATPMNVVPPGEGITNNMPGFSGTASGGSALECVVQ